MEYTLPKKLSKILSSLEICDKLLSPSKGRFRIKDTKNYERKRPAHKTNISVPPNRFAIKANSTKVLKKHIKSSK